MYRPNNVLAGLYMQVPVAVTPRAQDSTDLKPRLGHISLTTQDELNFVVGTPDDYGVLSDACSGVEQALGTFDTQGFDFGLHRPTVEALGKKSLGVKFEFPPLLRDVRMVAAHEINDNLATNMDPGRDAGHLAMFDRSREFRRPYQIPDLSVVVIGDPKVSVRARYAEDKYRLEQIRNGDA